MSKIPEMKSPLLYKVTKHQNPELNYFSPSRCFEVPKMTLKLLDRFKLRPLVLENTSGGKRVEFLPYHRCCREWPGRPATGSVESVSRRSPGCRRSPRGRAVAGRESRCARSPSSRCSHCPGCCVWGSLPPPPPERSETACQKVCQFKGPKLYQFSHLYLSSWSSLAQLIIPVISRKESTFSPLFTTSR